MPMPSPQVAMLRERLAAFVQASAGSSGARAAPARQFSIMRAISKQLRPSRHIMPDYARLSR